MTLTAVRGRLYLFGGCTNSNCLQDLQILDRSDMVWLTVIQHENSSPEDHHPENEDSNPRWEFGTQDQSPSLPRSTVRSNDPFFSIL